MRIGIVMCKMFDEEISYLLRNDKELSKVYVIQSKDSENLAESLRKNKVNVEIITDITTLKQSDAYQFEVIVDVLELGLHIYKEKLKPTVLDRVKIIRPYVDSIMLTYGLCGNTLVDIDDVIRREKLPMVIPKDNENYIVDDCVGIVLGGKRAYWNELRKECGTWFMTSGWSRYTPDILTKDLGAKTLEMQKYILKEVSHYKRVLVLRTGIEDAEYDDRCQQFAKQMDLRIEEKNANLDLFFKTWKEAKELAAKNLEKKCIPDTT